MVWNKNLPIEGALAPTYNDIMRDDKTALEAALNAYMYFATGGTQTGQPRQGSARPYFQDTAPTARLDGDYFDSTDLGTPWIDSNASPDNQFNILTAADGAGTETWTPISTEIIAVLLAANRIFAGTLKSTGDFTVGANKLTVAAATGNTVVAGTLGVTGVATVAKGSLLASSDAPTADAMIANKKFVDDAAQIVGAKTSSVSTGTTIMPGDDTIPQKTEGDEYMTQAITPVSATSKLKIDVTIVLSSGTSSRHISIGLFQDNTANALAAIRDFQETADNIHTYSFSHIMTSGTTSPTTFKVRAGPDDAATITFNGTGGARRFGGVCASSIIITEIRG